MAVPKHNDFINHTNWGRSAGSGGEYPENQVVHCMQSTTNPDSTLHFKYLFSNAGVYLDQWVYSISSKDLRNNMNMFCDWLSETIAIMQCL